MAKHTKGGVGRSTNGRVEIRVSNVNKEVKKELISIAKYEGKTLSDMLRPALREICNKYSIEIREGRLQ